MLIARAKTSAEQQGRGNNSDYNRHKKHRHSSVAKQSRTWRGNCKGGNKNLNAEREAGGMYYNEQNAAMGKMAWYTGG